MNYKNSAHSRTLPKFVVRFSEETMRDRIAELARRNRRSMNSELLCAIENHVNGTGDTENTLAGKISRIRNPRDQAILNAVVDSMLAGQ